MTEIIILAAGKGTRMRSSMPKVLHELAGKPFLQHVIDASQSLNAEKISVVVGHGGEQIRECIQGDNLVFIEQTQQLGTGHAVTQALPEITAGEVVLILYGDVPLISPNTLEILLSQANNQALALLTINLENPDGYGRIVRNEQNQVKEIVEQKDALQEQLKINEINTGVMAVYGEHLQRWLPQLSNSNAQGEYYLTDIIAMAKADGIAINTSQPSRAIEVSGVNNRAQQAVLEREYQHYQAEKLMDAGLTLLDPNRFDLRGSLRHGNDCKIDINCIFEGKNTLGNNITVGPNCTLKNAKIGNNSAILANSVIEDAIVGEHCNVGPFARLRPGTVLANQARIGNFVETKKANIGIGSKVNHLSYIGDAEVGNDVNIGAGTITCNYDGVNKSKTTIGDGAFVGSNSAIVAPITLGKRVTVGAGAVVTKNASDDQLVVARAKQHNMDGWERPKKK